MIDEQCQKEKTSLEEVNFYKSRRKKLAQKNILFYSEYVRDTLLS